MASTSSSKICVGSLTRSLRTSICQRETHHSRPKPLGCMPTLSLIIQSTQPGPTLHGTNTRHQFPFLNHQTELLTLTTRCRKTGVTSLNVQPLILKVVRPVHGHVWHSPRTWKQSQYGYLVVIFLDAASIEQWLDHGEVYGGPFWTKILW